MMSAADAAASLRTEVVGSLCGTSAEEEPATRYPRPNRARELARLVDTIYLESSDLERWARSVVLCMEALFPGREIALVVVEKDSLAMAGTTPAAVDRLALAGAERVLTNPIELVDDNGRATLGVLCDRHRGPTAYERVLLARATLHVENGLRLRSRRGRIQRVVSEAGESPSARLLAGMRSVHLREIWDALTGGCATLARLGHGCYAVIDATIPSRHRALSCIERSIVTLAARGLPGKALAYELGLAPAAVSRHLGNAAAKLGLASALELVRVTSHVATDRSPALQIAKLTAAERDVLSLVRAGLSNAAIARARRRSVRTVANQVASLLRKTKSPSRRMLMARDERPYQSGDEQKLVRAALDGQRQQTVVSCVSVGEVAVDAPPVWQFTFDGPFGS